MEEVVVVVVWNGSEVEVKGKLVDLMLQIEIGILRKKVVLMFKKTFCTFSVDKVLE